MRVEADLLELWCRHERLPRVEWGCVYASLYPRDSPYVHLERKTEFARAFFTTLVEMYLLVDDGCGKRRPGGANGCRL